MFLTVHFPTEIMLNILRDMLQQDLLKGSQKMPQNVMPHKHTDSALA